MREIIAGALSKEDFTRGGAPSTYVISARSGIPVDVEFQRDPQGFGVTNEALISIVIDRLEHFQKGEFPCHENESSLMHLRLALECLGMRTIRMQNQNIEGSYEEKQ